MIKIGKSKSGFSLIETTIAVVIIGLIVVSGFIFHAPLRENINRLEARFTAINLASSQIEHLKEVAKKNYAHSSLISGTYENVALPDIDVPEGFTVSYDVEDKIVTVNLIGAGVPSINMDYKLIRVTAAYPGGNQLQLVGFIVQDAS